MCYNHKKERHWRELENENTNGAVLNNLVYKMLTYVIIYDRINSTFEKERLINMAQATFSVRMDDGLKKKFDALCSDFGMSVSTAITVFAKAVVREQRIPFEITASEPFYSESNQNYLKKSLEDYRAGRLTKHDLIEVEDE